MNSWIIAVGGTGQMVAHYYLQLALLGAGVRNARISIVDTDQSLRSLRYLEDSFLPLIEYGLGVDERLERVPRVDTIQVRPRLQGNDIMHLLTMTNPPEGEGFEHEVQAYFTREMLSQAANQGLFARPALSAVVALAPLLRALDTAGLEDNTRIVLVSSCIGGTGGGLTVPLLFRLQSLARSRTNVSLRLVLLGRYFEFQQGVVGDEQNRFESNKTLFLKALSESVADLHSYAFIENVRMPGRDQRNEADARHMPWPEIERPYWKALTAVHYLLTESARAMQPDFSAKCVAENEHAGAIRRDEADRLLHDALGRVNALIQRKLVLAAEREPFPARQWGRPFANLIGAYYRRALAGAGGDARALDGAAQRVQEELMRVWAPPRAEYGLGTLFPQIACRTASPNQMRSTGWLQMPDAGAGMPDAKRAATAMAATLLLSAIGYGGR